MSVDFYPNTSGVEIRIGRLLPGVTIASKPAYVFVSFPQISPD